MVMLTHCLPVMELESSEIAKNDNRNILTLSFADGCIGLITSDNDEGPECVWCKVVYKEEVPDLRRSSFSIAIEQEQEGLLHHSDGSSFVKKAFVYFHVIGTTALTSTTQAMPTLPYIGYLEYVQSGSSFMP